MSEGGGDERARMMADTVQMGGGGRTSPASSDPTRQEDLQSHASNPRGESPTPTSESSQNGMAVRGFVNV
jgi:hypothetical protein